MTKVLESSRFSAMSGKFPTMGDLWLALDGFPLKFQTFKWEK